MARMPKKKPLASRQFQAPIPGQSLVDTPRGKPYERPPEIADPEAAIQQITGRLTDEDRTKSLVDLLESGITVFTATKGILRSAVSEGFISLDTALVIAPAIHEYIKTTAEIADADYEEGLEDEPSEKETADIAAAKAIHRAREKKAENTQREESVEEPVQGLEEESAPSGRGFMERRAV